MSDVYAASVPNIFVSYASQGNWRERYWKNMPGPIYSTTLNMLSLLACNNAKDFILFDDACEFLWRQPRTKDGFDRCLRAIQCDEASSFQIDGNSQWTPALVREWWSRKLELIDWCNSLLHRKVSDSCAFWSGNVMAVDQNIVREYLRYLESEAEIYLRSYIFLLSEGRPALANDKLPLV